MNDFLSALQFLTVVPFAAKSAAGKKMANSLIFFPLAGLLIGIVLAGLGALLSVLHFYELTAAIILVVALAAITGGLHLDGLSDTLDGLMCGKDRDKCLEVMRDPHSGAMGVIGIVCVFLLKIGLIFSLSPRARPDALILMCVLSRWSMVETMFLFPYARSEGKAKVFIEHISGRQFRWATAIAAAIAVLAWQVKGLLIFAAAGSFAWLFSKMVSRKLGGITGDTLGAQCELTEVAALFFIILTDTFIV